MKSMYQIEFYKTASGRVPVIDYVRELEKNSKHREIAQIWLYIGYLSEYGFAVNNHFPETIRKVQGDLYELRPGSNRVFFFHVVGNRIVLLHAYKKQSQKAPKKEIEKAEREMKDCINRGEK